jgi:hypothetical protein
VAISLVLGGVGGCGAGVGARGGFGACSGLGAHELPRSADSKMGVRGVRGVVLMCRDGNALGGKLRRLMGLYVAGGSSSGPSKSLRSGVGLLLSCTVIVVLFFVLASGAFSLALNHPPGPCGGSVCLLGDIGTLSYVCFIVLVLIVLLRCLFCMAWLRSHSCHHVGRGAGATHKLVHQEGPTWVLISSVYLVIIHLS